MRQAGEVTYADAHKREKNMGYDMTLMIVFVNHFS